MPDEENRNLPEEQENEELEEQDTVEESTEDEEENKEEESEETTEEDSVDFDSMSDDEFEKYFGINNTEPKKEEKVDTNHARIISKPDKQEKQEKKEPDTKVDYEGAYKAIFKPFKANGKEITPKTADDVISLMQMGANYTKKMQLMAPMKRAVESLNNAQISEDDLNFLIDIHKGDKEAIKQLLKKHQIDPIDLDLEDVKYSANKKNIASDEDIAFSDALLDSQESLPKMQEILNKTWDKQSKARVLKDPNLMRALHEEIQLGRFDSVQSKLEEERMFGRYKGVSDLDAYIHLVTNMVNEARAKEVAGKSKSDNSTTNTKQVPDKSKAAPTRNKASKGKASLTVKDLLSMDEDEFNKLSERDLV